MPSQNRDYFYPLTKHTRGFTLLELLIVIAIISILASLLMVNFSRARMEGRDTKRITDIQQIKLALEQYYNACKQYPSPASASNTLDAGASNGCPTGVTFSSFLTPIPVDPNGSAYAYVTSQVSSKHVDYRLKAALETTDPLLDSDVDDNTPLNTCADDESAEQYFYCVKP